MIGMSMIVNLYGVTKIKIDKLFFINPGMKRVNSCNWFLYENSNFLSMDYHQKLLSIKTNHVTYTGLIMTI